MPEPADELRDALVEFLSTSAAIGVAHLDGTGTITSANAALERLAGRPLAGCPIHDLLPVEQRPVLERLLASPERRWQRRQIGLFPDERGIPLDFVVSCRPVGDLRLLIAEPSTGDVQAVDEQLLALNDQLAVAQRRVRRQHAEVARRNDRLRELDELKDALLANVSHDLRTPLAAILGYAELLRRRGGLSDRQADAIDVIERNARRLLRLVSDLLLLAQTRTGELGLELEAIDLAGVAAEAVELTRPLADHAGLTLELEAPPPGAVVDADPRRLAHLLDNLIANAIKFTPGGGAVTVRVRDAAGTAALEVQDTGPGIPSDEQQRLFEPFTRGSDDGIPGTGLGLNIVRAIADAHHATIDLHSRPGEGTRITVGFPCRRA